MRAAGFWRNIGPLGRRGGSARGLRRPNFHCPQIQTAPRRITHLRAGLCSVLLSAYFLSKTMTLWKDSPLADLPSDVNVITLPSALTVRVVVPIALPFFF